LLHVIVALISLLLLAGLFGSDESADESAQVKRPVDAEVIRHRLDIEELL